MGNWAKAFVWIEQGSEGGEECHEHDGCRRGEIFDRCVVCGEQSRQAEGEWEGLQYTALVQLCVAAD